MELRQLRYFVAVAEELSFRRAADRLNISQPPLSKHVQLLEHALGARLFERSKQRVALTPAGREFLTHARSVLAGIAAAKVKVAEAARGARGELRVGYTESAIHVDPLLRGFERVRAEAAQVTLTLVPMKSVLQLAALEFQELDVGLVWAVPERSPSSLRFEPIWREPLVVALPRRHPLAGEAGPLPLEALRDQVFVTVSRDGGTLMFRTTVRLCAAHGFTPEVGREGTDLADTIGLVASGAGIALVPSSMRCFQAPGVRYRPVAGQAPWLHLHWVARRHEPSPLVSVLRAAVQAELGGTSGMGARFDGVDAAGDGP